MGEHTSSNQTSPTDSSSDFPPLRELFDEAWNNRGKHREATRKPDARRGSNEDPRAGSSSSAKRRRSIDQSSPNQSSSFNTSQQHQRRRSSTSMDNNNNNTTTTTTTNEASSGCNAAASSSIPRLTTSAVAIFVPLTNGQALLTPPAVAPDTPPYFLEKLERLSAHGAAVRGNIEALYGLELLRVRAEAASAYAADDASFDYAGAAAAVRPAHEAALRKNLDDMVDNMRKPDPANLVTLNPVKKDAVALPNMFVDVTYHPINSPREAAANDVLRLLGAAATELGSFDNHVQAIGDGIKREMQGAAARGMREKQDRMDTD